MDSQEIQVLRLQPGDTLVFKTPQTLTIGQARLVKEHLKALAPLDVDVLILDGGSALAVIRGEDGE